MSLFGVLEPKCNYNSIDYLLDHTITSADEPDNADIMNESVINRHREWVDRGEHYHFAVTISLHKYADPSTAFNNFYALKGQLVKLWRHRDGIQFQDKDGNDVLFRVNKVVPFYLQTADFKDTLYMEFVSQDVVDISKSAVYTTAACRSQRFF